MRSQRLLKVHRLHPTPLQPSLQNGVIVWTQTALILHLLWAWQFLISICVEVALIMLHAPWGWDGLKTQLLVLVAINTPFCALPILEACLYANLALTSTRYLLLQLPKVVFYSVIFALRIVWFQGWCISSIEGVRRKDANEHDDKWYIAGRIIEELLFFPPYILALLNGIVLLRRDRAGRPAAESKLAPDRILVVVTPADEETRLLG